MNRFYLKVDKTDAIPIKLVIGDGPGPMPDSGQSRGSGLWISQGKNPQMMHSGETSLFCIGSLTYQHTWHCAALRLIAHDLDAGLGAEEITRKAGGQFCLVVHTPHAVQVITDRLGTFPIYKVEGPDKIEVSNSLRELARNNRVTVDRQALAEVVNLGYCLDTTLFHEIQRLDMASIYRISDEGLKHQKYDNVFEGIAFDRYTTLEEVAPLAKEILQENLAFLKSVGKVFVDITGGFDTRIVATLLHAGGVAFEAGICGEQVLGEIQLARQVADVLGRPLNSNIAITDRLRFDQVLQQHYAITTGVPILYHSTELINYYNSIAGSFDIHVTGFGGSEVMEQTLPKMRLFSSRVSHRGICMRKEWLYKDVFRKSVMTEAEFYLHLSEKLDRLIGMIGSDLYYRVGNALSVLDFSRNYAGCLMGTHNTIMPVYTPFLEGNYVRLMLETSYDLKSYHQLQRLILTEVNKEVSRIRTSHGYAAGLSDEGGPRAAMKAREWCKDRARQILYGSRLFGAKDLAERVTAALGHRKHPEHIHRRFWMDAVDDAWSWDMPIFDLIDRDHLNRILQRESQAARLKALVLYLNRMITESGVRV